MAQIAPPASATFTWAPGTMTPPAIRDMILNAVITGANFASTVVRVDITNNSLNFPVIAPSGQAWVGEGETIPDVNLNESVVSAIPVTLGGIVRLTNELVDDVTDQPGGFDLETAVGNAMRDAFSYDLDKGLMMGSGTPPEPKGLISVVASAVGADLFAQAIAAVGAIGDAGGNATHLAIKPSSWAAEQRRIAASLRDPWTGLALEVVPVPGLTAPVVYDATRIYLVVRDDFSVEVNPYDTVSWSNDAVALRVKGRFNLAVPVPAQAARELAVA